MLHQAYNIICTILWNLEYFLDNLQIITIPRFTNFQIFPKAKINSSETNTHSGFFSPISNYKKFEYAAREESRKTCSRWWSDTQKWQGRHQIMTPNSSKLWKIAYIQQRHYLYEKIRCDCQTNVKCQKPSKSLYDVKRTHEFSHGT